MRTTREGQPPAPKHSTRASKKRHARARYADRSGRGLSGFDDWWVAETSSQRLHPTPANQPADVTIQISLLLLSSRGCGAFHRGYASEYPQPAAQVPSTKCILTAAIDPQRATIGRPVEVEQTTDRSGWRSSFMRQGTTLLSNFLTTDSQKLASSQRQSQRTRRVHPPIHPPRGRC